jgi:hypothetical protein
MVATYKNVPADRRRKKPTILSTSLTSVPEKALNVKNVIIAVIGEVAVKI